MSDKRWSVKSPDSMTGIVVYCLDNVFNISCEKSSRPVLDLKGISFDEGFHILSSFNEEYSTIDETYSLPAGKNSVYRNHSNNLKISFNDGDDRYALCIRVFDDGFAYKLCTSATSVAKENLSVTFPDGYRNSFLQEWIDTYERPFPKGRIEEKRYGMPCLFELDSAWVLASEAGIINNRGHYCSSSYLGKDSCLNLAFAPEETGPIKNPNGVETPWRFFTVVNDLFELIDSRMAWNLNPTSEIDDQSWIASSRNLWSWWSFENGAELFTEQMKYIDFAAAYEFEGVTVDAGWDDTWVPELCKYAKRKGIKVWIWSDMGSLDSYEKAKPLIEKWASWGVDGLKIDFFMNDSSLRMGHYDHIARLMIENKLLINYHGNTKAAGESRTWPCLLTGEGIMGLEHYKWSDMPNAVHNCTVPFTRNVIGSMDYTPTGFTNVNRNTTHAHQLALALVFESGVLHIAESIHALKSWKGTDFLRRLKPTYDTSRLLYGYPGTNACFLRSKGDEVFVAGITVHSEQCSLPLSFLTEGTYEAELYVSSHDGDDIEKMELKVTRDDSLELSLADADGFALYCTKKKKPLPLGEERGYMGKVSAVIASVNNRIDFSEEKIEGTHDVHLFYTCLTPCVANISGKNVPLEPAGSLSSPRVLDFTFDFDIEPLVITTADAVLWRAEVKEEQQSKHLYLDAAQSSLNPSFIIRDNGCVRGADNKHAIVFSLKDVQESGRYIVAFDYCLGENRKALIRVNGVNYEALFFNTGGWVEGNWSIIGRKELLLPLRKGENIIEFLSTNGAAPDLKGIEVWFYDKG